MELQYKSIEIHMAKIDKYVSLVDKVGDNDIEQNSSENKLKFQVSEEQIHNNIRLFHKTIVVRSNKDEESLNQLRINYWKIFS